jgi:hypothetical protein
MTEASQLESLHAHFHDIAHFFQMLGVLLIGSGIFRFVSGPRMAARKIGRIASFEPGGMKATEYVSIDAERLKRGLPERPIADDGELRARGLTDFYRMQAGLTALAGVVLVIITLVAG